MPVYKTEISLTTSGFCDVIDITEEVQRAIGSSEIMNGIAVFSVAGATASITTVEYEKGVVEDLKNAIKRLAPENIPYNHDAKWGDGNGFSHVRAALLGPSLSLPVIDGSIVVGTWQQVVLIDFDNRPRRRKIIAQIVGE